MIATGTPLDFIMGFNKRRTTGVLLTLLIHTGYNYQSWSGSLHQDLSLCISLYLTSIFTTKWFKYLSSYFTFCFTVSLSSFWPNLSPLSLSNLHVFVFFALFSTFSFLPPSWPHRDTSRMRSCRKHIKEGTPANPEEQYDCKLYHPEHATRMYCMCATAMQVLTRPRALQTHFLSCTYTHINAKLSTLPTNSANNPVMCVSPQALHGYRIQTCYGLELWWDWGVGGNLVFHLNVSLLPGRHPVYCFTLWIIKSCLLLQPGLK